MDPIRFLMDLEAKIKAMSQAERAHVGKLIGGIMTMVRDATGPTIPPPVDEN